MASRPTRSRNWWNASRITRQQYTSNLAYKEAQLRQEFLDPLFKALGWDVDNEQGYAEAYKDVVHEDASRTGRATKAPDYCFRIGGARKFFLEAKKPAVNLREDAGGGLATAALRLERQAALEPLVEFRGTARL